MTAKPMRITAKVTVEITPEQLDSLAIEYGLADGGRIPAAVVREFVKSYIREHAQGSAAAEHWTATVA